MSFCKHCGDEAQKGDVYCRKCGTKIPKKPVLDDGAKQTIAKLTSLVDDAVESIKKELLWQITDIEKGVKTGLLNKEEFKAEADEIRGRLLNFIKK
jgi:uncharacterized membrane protein YvbJ